jgi:hypothetical protein
MKKNIFLIFAFLLFIFPFCASAHQPNYVKNKSTVFDSEPTISKAYYGELSDQPTIYTINSSSVFDMYVNVLSPDTQNSFKNYIFIIRDSNNNIIKNISNDSSPWVRWYEDFGGDWYWKGPEFKEQFPAGTYTISVQNPTNTGKYVLAIGETESFPVGQTFRTLKELYTIKTSFFNEPWYGIFYGIIGKYLLFGLIILGAILIVLVWFFVRKLIIRHKKLIKRKII